MEHRRIDVHQQLVPQPYADWLRSRGIADPSRVVCPVVRDMARRVNEEAATLASRHPARVGFFATPTLPDVDGALAEAAYALDTLGASGVVLLANTHGPSSARPSTSRSSRSPRVAPPPPSFPA